jgi:hypothetical protein
MMEMLVRTEGDGWLLPRFAPPPWPTIVSDLRGVADSADMRWMVERLGPTPVRHFTDPLQLSGAVEAVPRAYVRCLRFAHARFDTHAAMSRQSPDWVYRELDSGHHAAITMPTTVSALLIELAA